MPQRSSETTGNTMLEQPDFSVVLGGPLFQLFRRAHLSGDALELLHRRILIITVFAWLPLALLSLLDGRAFGEAVKIPFLYDIEAHVRFLIALPMLIIAELVVHRRISPVVRRFVERRIVVTEDMPKFAAAVNSASARAQFGRPGSGAAGSRLYGGALALAEPGAVGIPTWYAVPVEGT